MSMHVNIAIKLYYIQIMYISNPYPMFWYVMFKFDIAFEKKDKKCMVAGIGKFI